MMVSRAERGPSLASRARKVTMLVLDVDGVLTDGRLLYGAAGEEIKRFHVRDGYALVAARRAGLTVAVISGRVSAAVTRRMAELGVDEVHQGVDDKRACLVALVARLGASRAQVAAMGDDVPDVPLLREAGLALAPSDAAREVRRVVHWTSRYPGGRGAVRDAVEMLLGARHAWPPPISATR
ncbi:MAG TPA: HAD family hydrolase [Verrucomicrobiae bacterium]|jgi:3-deoxy-D-manno-octulosonate 8-phosphate phosphatase (KDO 8-P phosphatase)|nr:HAD family hydrolase [Verrucomicrobiae bacterium]